MKLTITNLTAADLAVLLLDLPTGAKAFVVKDSAQSTDQPHSPGLIDVPTAAAQLGVSRQAVYCAALAWRRGRRTGKYRDTFRRVVVRRIPGAGPRQRTVFVELT